MSAEPAWPQASADGRARRAALQGGAFTANPTALIEYRSAGHLLIIGEAHDAMPLAERLAGPLSCYVLAPPGTAGATGDTPNLLGASLASLGGHLGAFEAQVAAGKETANLARLLRGGEQQHFDLVLDLQDPPALPHQVPPAGYYAPRGDAAALDAAVAELGELVGEFEKPKYFNYDPDICAHGRNGKRGCERCFAACPTRAIRSVGDRIEVDPYLCQGGGGCATACPSGAITYAYPSASELLDYLRGLLARYFDAGGADPVLLFYDRERGAPAVHASAARLPEQVLPVEVEEIGAVGLDVWLAALAFGAAEVALYTAPGTPPASVGELRRQLDYAGALLEALDIAATRIRVLDAPERAAEVRQTTVCRAPFATFDEKRNTVFNALDRLLAQGARAGEAPAAAPLPAGAPFGTVEVDTAACTVCLACASACPAGALLGGTDTPMLRFIEGKCLQCGLCELTCPEGAIGLRPRMLFDAAARREARVQHEEQPFHCLECGKPFATQKIIDTMQRKLEGHWMFGDAAAMRRLRLCDECRVKDIFRKGTGMDALQ